MFKESDKGADPAKTFTVKDAALIVAGKPTCYIHTEKGYSNYVPAAAPRRSGCPASGGSHVERAAPARDSGRAGPLGTTAPPLSAAVEDPARSSAAARSWT
jgi:hypothetical protein